jgi:hypothetical protein
VNGWLDGMALALYDIVSAANEWGHCVCVCVQKFVPRRSERTHTLGTRLNLHAVPLLQSAIAVSPLNLRTVYGAHKSTFL